MKTTTLLLLAEFERRQKKARKKMSRLTAALAAFATELENLKARVAAKEQADSDALTAANAEADAAAAQVESLTVELAAIDGTNPVAPAPVDENPTPPAE